MKLSIGACVLACMVGGNVAEAAEVVLTVGLAENLAIPQPEHLGLYPSLGIGLAFLGDTVNLIPSFGVECAPELSTWGFVASLTLDFPVSKYIGIDLTVSLIHDQEGMHFEDSLFYAGLGVGFSVFIGDWSIAPSAMVVRGINDDEWSWSPGLTLGLML